MLWKCCTQCARKFGKLSSGHRTRKGQFSFQSQRKAMPKNAQTTAELHSAQASKVMLKILQARIQQFMNCELPDVQAGFRKGRWTRDQIANILWIIEKARESQKNIYYCFSWLITVLHSFVSLRLLITGTSLVVQWLRVCSYSHLLRNFPQVVLMHAVKGFGLVHKAEIDVFLELSCFFNDPKDVGNLISGSSAYSKSSLNMWNFMVYVLLKLDLEDFEHYFASMWDECNCAVVFFFFFSICVW